MGPDWKFREKARKSRSRPFVSAVSLVTALGVLFSQAVFLHQPAIAAETERGRVYASLWQERRAAREAKPQPLLAWAGPQSPALPPLDHALDLGRQPFAGTPAALRRRRGLPLWTKTLPLAWAEVQAVHQGNAKDPWIVLIEDLHNQEESQRNISRVLEHMGEKAGQRPMSVAIEGGAGIYDFSPFRHAGPPDAVRRAADHFLKKGWISGAQFAGLTSDHSINFFGAEDPVLYNANIEAYQTSRPLLTQTDHDLAEAGRHLAQRKGTELSEKARILDEARTQFHGGSLPIQDYLSKVSGLTPVKPSGQLARFLNLMKREAVLDFAAVERERGELLERLARQLDRRSLEDLTSLTVAYRAGEVTYGVVYDQIEKMAKKAGIRFGSSFQGYLDYLAQAEAIDRRAFLNELTAYEETAAQSLLRNETERHLWRESSQLVLADKLVHQNLMAQEWQDYVTFWETETTTSLGAPSPASS